MRRPVALVLTICSLAVTFAAGLAAPAALAAKSATSTVTTAASSPSTSSSSLPTSNFGLGNAESNSTQPTTTTAATVTSSSTGGGISGFDAVLIGLIVALVLVGICFWVWYDARSNVAQLRHGGGTAADPMFARSHPGSKRPRGSRKPKVHERKRRKRGRAR